MMAMLRPALFCFLVGVVLLSASPAFSYELTGARWNTIAYPGGVPWCPREDTAGDANSSTKRAQFLSELQDSMNRWSGNVLECSAYFPAQTTCTGSPNPNSDEPWVYWEPNWGSVPGVGSSTIGITLSWISGGWFSGGKVIFNDRDYTWDTQGNQTDVGSIATHEFGHFVGMDHYDEYSSQKRQQCYYNAQYPSVMCAAHTGGVVRQLTTDDIQGVCSIYPNNGAVGSPCDSNSDCNDAICHSDGYCTESCTTSSQCPTGYDCTGGECVRESAGTSCPPCGDLPCTSSSTCVGAGNFQLCTNACNSSANCPLGFYCAAAQGGASICFPAANSCDESGPGPGENCGPNGSCALGNVCLSFGASSLCYAMCEDAGDCSSDETCVSTVQQGVRYCDSSVNGGGNNNGGDTGNNGGNQDGGGDCSCNMTSGQCEANCSCDPDCGSGASVACECDVYFGCDADCACDLDCVCECDEYYGCDEGCECDTECTGCFNAAILPPRGNSNMADLTPLFLILLGIGFLRRRRS